MSDSQEKKEKLKARIQVAKDKLEEYKRRGMADIIIRVKEENIDKEVKIETLGKKLDEIKKSIEELPDEEIVNFDETELEIKEAIIKELGKTLPCKPLVPRINISIKKKRWCWKNTGQKLGVKDYILSILLVISMVGIILACKLHENCELYGYIIGLLSGVIMGGFMQCIFIKYCIDEKYYCYKIRMLLSFVVNFLLSMAPMFFVIYPKNLSKLSIYFPYLIAIILLLIITCYFTKIENGNDISLLKASNLFLAFLFTAIKLLLEQKNISEEEKLLIEIKKFFIEYYYLLPLIGLRALYDLFDGKAKKNAKEA